VIVAVTSRAGVHKKGTFSLLDLLNSVKKESEFQKAGAIAMFVGVVRGETLNGERVEKLELEAYEEKANEVLASICDDLRKRAGIIDVQIHHLLGEFKVGEDMVYVLVAGSHRQNMFSVLEEAVERYKKEAPIFKKEHVVTGRGARKAYWITEHESGSRKKAEQKSGKVIRKQKKCLRGDKVGEKKLHVV
jgi:molybdopterin synthase catalytic subunit